MPGATLGLFLFKFLVFILIKLLVLVFMILKNKNYIQGFCIKKYGSHN
ncbi:hypothetical protein J22TS1_12890 [Siminovitchia terrae]|nr:hypothetical protein J22TS1_12890 [Siminovitchia terrae]